MRALELDEVQDGDLCLVLAVLEDGREDEDAELVSAEYLQVGGDQFRRVFEHIGHQVLEYPLDDAAAVLVQAEVDQVLLDGVNNEADLFQAKLLRLVIEDVNLAHLYDDFLHDVVAVEIEAALEEFVGLQECAKHAYLLVDSEHFEGGLEDAAAVLVTRVPVHIFDQLTVDMLEVAAWHGALARL